MSAWNCISRSSRVIPPSTRSSSSSRPVSATTASTTSRVWNAVDSSAARAMCALLTKRVSPTSAPRASGRQYGREQARERRARSRRRRCRRRSTRARRRLRSGLDDAEVVAQPLHERAGDRDRALERVARRLVAAPVRDRRDEPVLRAHDLGAGVHEQEVARAVRVLRLAGVERRLPEGRRLLVAEDARRSACPRAAGGSRTSPTTSDDERISGIIDRGMPPHLEQLVRPVERAQVHEQRAARVGDIGDMDAAARAAGEVPDHPRVGRAEQQVARPRRPRARPARCRGSTRSWMPRSRSRAAGRSPRRTASVPPSAASRSMRGWVRVSCQTRAL